MIHKAAYLGILFTIGVTGSALANLQAVYYPTLYNQKRILLEEKALLLEKNEELKAELEKQRKRKNLFLATTVVTGVGAVATGLKAYDESQQLKSLKNTIDWEKRLLDHAERLDNVVTETPVSSEESSEVEGPEATEAVVSEDYAALEKNLKELEQDLDKLSKKVQAGGTSSSQDVAKLKNALGKLRGSLGGLKRRVSKNENDIIRHEAGIDALIAQMERLEEVIKIILGGGA